MRPSGSNLIQTKNKKNKKAKEKTKALKTKNKHKDAKKNKAPHDEQCSTTCFYTMSVRLLSGKLQQLSVKPDTTILSIKVQLENQLNPPSFTKSHYMLARLSSLKEASQRWPSRKTEKSTQ